MDLGPNAAFIWWAYGMVAVVLTGLVVWLIVDGRDQERRLKSLEARGVKRRSESGSAASNE